MFVWSKLKGLWVQKIEDYNNLEITKKEMREIAISTLSTEKDFKSLSQIAI